MLGNYATEPFKTGRGLQVRKNAVSAMATLCGILGLDPLTIRLHKEDPLTTHDCPENRVVKLEVLNDVQSLIVERHAGEHIIN